MTKSDLQPSDEQHQMAPGWAMELSASLALIFCIVGFFGNILTILALPYTRKLRNAATWFVLNLAATELLFCVTILPMSAAHLLHLTYTEKPLLGAQGCRFFVFLRYVIVQAELLSIAAIALNRCILISFPKKYPLIFTSRKTAFFIFAIWVLSLVIMVFPLANVFGSFAYNPNTQECDFGKNDKIPRKVLLILGFFPSCIIIIASYSYIFFKARQSALRIRKRMNNNGNTLDDQRERPVAGLRNRDMRIARTIGAIFLSFIICCTPVTFAHFYLSHGGSPTILLLLHPLYWLQYCLNIFIYVLMNKQYREAYIKYLAYWCPSIKKMNVDIEKLGEEETSASFYNRQQEGVKGRLFKKLSDSLRCSSRDTSNSDFDSSCSTPKNKQKRRDLHESTRINQDLRTDAIGVSPPRNIPLGVGEERSRKVSFSTSPPMVIPPGTNHLAPATTQHSKKVIMDQKDFDAILLAD